MALLEHVEEPRIPEEWFNHKLPKDFYDDLNEAIRGSTTLDYCMHMSMVIFHKNHRVDFNILSEKLILKLSKKERRDAYKLEKHF